MQHATMEQIAALVRLQHAALKICEIADSGELFAGCDGAEPQRTVAVTAFDELEAATTEAAQMLRRSEADAAPRNPFIAYRDQIMGGYSTAYRLADLVLHLYNGNEWTLNITTLLANADELHTRIALELQAWYARHGENDHAFMALAREILRRDHPELLED